MQAVKRMRALATGLVLALAGATTAMAEQAQFDLVMKGITAGTLVWSGTGAPGGAYQVSGTLRTSGLAALLRTVRYDATARGTISRRGIWQPQAYAEDANTGKRQSNSQISWKNGVPAQITETPVRPARAYDVDPATQKGAVDPLTAMFATLRDVAPGQECNQRLEMFDGRRATRLVLGPPQRQGDAVVCAGEYRRIAGFSDKDMAEKTRFPFTLTLRPAGDMMRVAEVATDTIYGKARLVRRR